MGKKSRPPAPAAASVVHAGKPSALLDTHVVYCGLRRAQSSRDNLEQLAKPALSLPNGLPDGCVDLTGGVYIDPAPVSEVELPFNSNRNYEVFWGETKAPLSEPSKTATPPRRPTSTTCEDRCVQLACVLK